MCEGKLNCGLISWTDFEIFIISVNFGKYNCIFLFCLFHFLDISKCGELKPKFIPKIGFNDFYIIFLKYII